MLAAKTQRRRPIRGEGDTWRGFGWRLYLAQKACDCLVWGHVVHLQTRGVPPPTFLLASWATSHGRLANSAQRLYFAVHGAAEANEDGGGGGGRGCFYLSVSWDKSLMMQAFRLLSAKIGREKSGRESLLSSPPLPLLCRRRCRVAVKVPLRSRRLHLS